MLSAVACLAMAIYFEARSEPIVGQYAVAEVIVNRVADKRFPNTVCEVVKQDKGPKAYDCQFSFWCDGKPETVYNMEAWHVAQAVAVDVLRGKTSVVGDALYYHVDTITTMWSKKLVPLMIVGNHVFFTD